MWAIGVAAVGVGSAAYSSYKGRKASKEATGAIVGAEEKANETQLQMYEQSRQDQLPWMQAGKRALTELYGGTTVDFDAGPGGGGGFFGGLKPTIRDEEGMIQRGPGDFTESEYYQQGLAEEEKAIDRYMASRGLYGSGKAGKALTENALANLQRGRGNWLNEWIATKLTPTQSLAGVGQTAAINVGREGTMVGRDIATGIRDIGAQRGAGYIDRSNITTQALQGGANALAQYYGSRPTGTGTGNINLAGPVKSEGMLLA